MEQVSLKVVECVASHMAICALLQSKLPVKTAYALVKIEQKLKPICDNYNSQRTSLLMQYGKQDEKNPDQYFIPQENIKAFNQELTDVGHLVESLEIPKIYSISDFGDSFEIEGVHLAVLHWLFKD